MENAKGQLPLVMLLATGGTIAMTRREDGIGVTPSLEASHLVTGVPAVAGVANIRTQTLCTVPSASLTLEHLLAVVEHAHRAVDGGAKGVVLTQGTDTLEESAFLLDLLWGREEPLVVTGAMRSATEPGADGPANVLAAVAAAVSEACRGLGCIVVMNGEVHAARQVQKRHSANPAAFASPDTGPIGIVREGRVHILAVPPDARLVLPFASTRSVRVALVEAAFDDDGELLSYCAQANYEGIVVAALGAGHLPKPAADRAISAAAVKPVILSSRTGAGGVFSDTYSFDGSESHLLGAGLISAGMLAPRKARILLTMLLRAGAQRQQIERAFRTLGGIDPRPCQAADRPPRTRHAMALLGPA